MKSAQNIFTLISRIFHIPFQLANHTIFSWKKLSDKNRYILLVVIFASFLILIPIALSILFNSDKAEAAWWNESWGYRQTVNITNTGTAQTDYQIAITLDTATLITNGKMRSDCNDIRITDTNGKLLPYWIEEGSAPCNNAATKIWTKVPSIYTSGNTLLLYYGNPSSSSYQNGNKVFDFFDDFNGNYINPSKWPDQTGTWTISGGVLASSTADSAIHQSNNSGSRVMETRLKGATTSTQSRFGLANDNYITCLLYTSPS